jgi:hypothetical protein
VRLTKLRLLVLMLGAVLAASAWVAPSAMAAGRLDLMIRDTGGRPVAGAAVTWSLLPTGQELPRGHQTTLGVHAAKADAHGRASVALSLTRRERALVANNGDWANVELAVTDDTGRPVAFQTIARYLGTRADQASQQRLTSAADPLVVEAPVQESAVTTQDTGCTNYHWERYSKDWNWTRVGELHSAGDTKVARFTYGRTADSSIDVGYRDSGSGWYLSGSAHIGNTRSSAVSISAGSNYAWGMLTQFNYALDFFYADCYQGSHRYQGHQRTYATSWRGSITNSYNLGQYDNNRNSHWNLFGRNAGFDRSSYRFKKWSGAVSVWGASLGARSGASAYVKLHYLFGSAQSAHYLYGNDNTPPYSHRVFASNK